MTAAMYKIFEAQHSTAKQGKKSFYNARLDLGLQPLQPLQGSHPRHCAQAIGNTGRLGLFFVGGNRV